MIFYYSPGSSSMAPHIALREIGAPFEGRPLSFARKEQRQPAYLTVNPEGKVPALVVDGLVLTEVAAVLFYLARKFPAAALLPEDSIETQARAISWMSFVASTLHPSRRRGLDAALEAFATAERRLGGDRWALDAYSIADIHLFRLYWRNRDWLREGGGSFPSLEAHHARMMARPAVQATIAAEQVVGYELP
jgi:glutathione S-transferase